MRKPGLLIAALLLVALALLWPRLTTTPDQPATAIGTSVPQRPGDAPHPSSQPPDASATLPEFLPREAHETLRLIARGGPFPHRQDGSVFGNREGRLPSKPRGYYREYTVDTPGLGHRGARRIVTGGDPPEAWYYSDDHYDSFQAFDPGPYGARR
ncbi:ribonuclease [Luteimonas sp. SX5]|uniref:Ribonuclease n=1 Tax=Luteimonas galliterrae TaxID=2940486 RepID=A0ABT0MEY3_9GAMM|nr:ribonuclease domain-containing protein [Luteimonas galliterrae]MCL1633436.1 ribonuclease [Luteimonas galliterrae]